MARRSHRGADGNWGGAGWSRARREGGDGAMPRGHRAFVSGALTRTVNRKEGPMWEDLEL